MFSICGKGTRKIHENLYLTKISCFTVFYRDLSFVLWHNCISPIAATSMRYTPVAMLLVDLLTMVKILTEIMFICA